MENSENEVNYAFVNFHLSPSSQSSFGSLVFPHLWINFCSFFTPVIKFLSWKPKLYFAFHSIGRVVVNILADERWARHVCITNSTKKKIIHWFFWVISLKSHFTFSLTAGALPVNHFLGASEYRDLLPWMLFGVLIYVCVAGEILTPRKCVTCAFRRFFFLFFPIRYLSFDMLPTFSLWEASFPLVGGLLSLRVPTDFR